MDSPPPTTAKPRPDAAPPPSQGAPPEPCVLVIFGASGDLTWRKLVPSLFELERRGELPERLVVLGVSRTPMSDDQYRDRLGERLREHQKSFDRGRWASFAKCIHYQTADATDPGAYEAINARIMQLGKERGLTDGDCLPNLLFYLSVAPDLYEPIIECIGRSGLVAEGKRWCAINPAAVPWQRIVVEKPFGTDLASAQSLNKALGRVFEEEAIFRIDHYLGKELVQNIMVLRWANTIFEPLWNRSYVDHVQVTAAETIGVGSRAANFYDSAGALRDMVQSHLLQVMALVAMEPPSVFSAAAIMREKIKLFDSALPVPVAEAPRRAVFGRYGADANAGEPAYAEEEGVDPARRTETFAAMRVEFDNWRWAGVPVYQRSGKKLARKLTEVVVEFKRPPHDMFRRVPPTMPEESRSTGAGMPGMVGAIATPGPAASPRTPNRLVINIAPSEGIILGVQGKVPGSGLRIDTAELDLFYHERFGGEVIEAYGPLLLDAMRGDRTLYKHRDEVEAGWRICQPLLESRELREGIEEYPPGSWGPGSAAALLAREGRAWHEPPAR